MTTCTQTWAQNFDPKNFSQYTTEAFAFKAETGAITRETAAMLDMLQRSIIRHWILDSELASRTIEKHEAALCVKLLITIYMPYLLLRNIEAITSGIQKKYSKNFAEFPHAYLSSECGTFRIVEECEDIFDQYVSSELDSFADVVYRLLKSQNADQYRVKLMSGKRYYSQDLRNKFLSLTNLALARGYKRYFITVYLSDEESDRLIKSKNVRSLQQKIANHLAAVLGVGNFAGIVVIEHSPSKAENFHLHMVIVTREIDPDTETQLRDRLRKMTTPNMKSAINIKCHRNLNRLKRPEELLNVHDDITTSQELLGIDIGLMDYLSKGLSPEMKIGIHKQVFSLNHELFFKNKMSSTLRELLTFLIERAGKHIQFDNKQAAQSQIKDCILSLVVGLKTKIYKRNLKLASCHIKHATT
ncbi:hypothetical protein [Alishewanella sp. HL-SH05]|uniref:hypothetical protein n=1 Tax=Alishewanella sp. HL-SH05 TaxID=3461145 RepID=UPI004042D7BF